MSAFNRYQWELYAEGKGKETIDRFRAFLNGSWRGYSAFIADLMKDFCPDEMFVDETYRSVGDETRRFIIGYLPVPDENLDLSEDRLFSQDEYDSILLKIYSKYLETTGSAKQAQWEISLDMGAITTRLAMQYPAQFIPYYFTACYNVVERIAAEFDIELPPIPAKGQKEKRVLFLGVLSRIFNEFRLANKLSVEELWAFLYDYAPKLVGGLDWVLPENELKEAHNVFVFGTSESPYLQNPDPGEIFIWQGSPEMKPGDIAVLYQWKPVSSFVSIWRAVSVGYNDPIFRHHRMVCYSAVCGIPNVKWEELKNDEVFSQTNLVRSKMTQMDGARMKNSEYMHLLEMAKKHGPLPETVPEMPVYSEIEIPELKLEKDVEHYLLEGVLLKRLGWEEADYLRQLPVRDGRSTHVFPDYVINYDAARRVGEIILEAKLTIPSEKQAVHDKGQAVAYARLIKARAIVLVAKEGIWLAQEKDDFNALKAYTWGELQDADRFDAVYQVIGKGKGKKGKKS